jgi:NADH-quinone oxidoreductase subunit A
VPSACDRTESSAPASREIGSEQGFERFRHKFAPSLGCRAVSDFLRSYLLVAIFGGVTILLVGGVLAIGSLIRPNRPQPEKYINYESGVDPVGIGWTQSQVRYYIFALLFVLFDVEAVFIFPFATRAEVYQWFGFVEMTVFIVILALGLLYAWRKKVLRWI